MDVIDIANDYAQQELDRNIAAKASNLSPERESATECDDCACEIPKARREAIRGCRLCVECQAIAERKRALRGR